MRDTARVVANATKLRELSAELEELEKHVDAHDREDFESCEICDRTWREKSAEYKRLSVDYAEEFAAWILEKSA